MIITMFSWGAFKYIYISVLIFISMTGFLWYRLYKKERALSLLAGSWMSVVVQHYSLLREWGKLFLSVIGVLCLCIALLRPYGKRIEDTIAQQGRDVYFALDVSRSMLATDIVPDRLTCAKEKIKRMISRLTCERVGLILFSGSAYIMCPLTADTGSFTSFLNQVDVETISSGTTALEGALTKALDAFEGLPAKKNKLLVILTDGEDFSSSLTSAQKRAQEHNLYVCAVGVGSSTGAPIPLFDHMGNPAGHQKDDTGAVVISQLNEHLLRSLVSDLKGTYVRLTNDDTDVKAIINKVQSFEKETVGDRHVKRFDENYPYFVLVSLICFIIEWLL